MRALDLFLGGFKMMKTYSKTAWMMIIPMAILGFAMNYYAQQQQFAIFEEALSNDIIPNPNSGFGTIMLTVLISTFFAAVIAVGWHRRVLLDESFSWSVGTLFRKPVWSYILGVIIIILIFIGIYILGALAIAFVGLIASMISPYLMIIIVPFVIAGFVWLIVFLTRVSLILPARALERPISVKTALASIEGQFWMLVRYILITLLAMCVVILLLSPFILPQFQAQIAIGSGQITDPTAILEALKPSKPSVLYLAITSIFGAVMSLHQVGIITILYAHFIADDKE